MQQTDTIDDWPDDLRDALGQVLAQERQQWRRERELIQSQASTVIAESRLDFLTLKAELTRLVEVRLAELRDGRDGEPGAPGDQGPPGTPGVQGENGAAALLPPGLAAEVASAARLLHELPPIVSRETPAGRVTRIERDDNGALVPIYES